MHKLTVLILLLALQPVAVFADAVDALNAALAPLKGLQGNFTQQQYDEHGEILLESSGRFSVLRPNYFSWEILAPDSQLVMTTPEYIWHHDRDLETVTRRPLTADGAMAPLQVLSGDEAILRSGFTVTQVHPDTFILRPSGLDAGFQELSLQLSDGEITKMEVLDNLDQTLHVQFTGLVSNGNLSPSDFAFVPPPEADLFIHE